MSIIKIGSPKDKKGIAVKPNAVLFNGSNVKKIMSGLTTIWENIIALIPEMTSNTSPSGEVVYSTQASGYDAYKAFDNNDSTVWRSATGSTKNQYLGYMFDKPVCVKSFTLKNYTNTTCIPYNYTVEAYNSNEWVAITDQITSDRTAFKLCEYSFENNNKYTGYRILMDKVNGGENVILFSLQFYGY